MGPLRRQLTKNLCFCLLIGPTTAFAEICDKERPLWDGTPVSTWQEAVFHLTSPAGWLLISALILALIFRRRWLWLLCAAIAALSAWAANQLPHLDDPQMPFFALMQQEGCTGPPHLSIGLCAAISIFSTYTALKRRKPKKDTTCSKD